MEPRLFGSWVDREGTKVEFWKDGTFLITCEGQQNFPVKWWVDDQSTLHALHPDEDASGWVSVPYRITGNDQLHLENSNFFKLPRELKRIGQ